RPHRDAGGEDEGLARDLRAVAQLDDAVRVLPANRDDLLPENLRSESLGLRGRPPREVGAGHARRKPEIVLDLRARSGLASVRSLPPRPSGPRCRPREVSSPPPPRDTPPPPPPPVPRRRSRRRRTEAARESGARSSPRAPGSKGRPGANRRERARSGACPDHR